MRNFENLNIIVLNREITPRERTLFNTRIRAIIGGRANLLYRGESKNRLQQKITYGFPSPFSDMLFLIGDKGRNFQNDIVRTHVNLPRRHINDTSEQYFQEIFHMIHDLLNFDNALVNGFISQNREFADFFTNPNNVNDFIHGLNQLSNKDQLRARDYYLTLLHAHSGSCYHPQSRFVSTTRDEGIAEIFQGNGTDPNDKVVFYLWMPWSDYGRYAIRFSYLEEIYEELLTARLPVYYNRFVHQSEVTLKGGILPHYLIGFSFFDHGEKKFSVNPNFVKDEIGANWIKDGVEIDQSDFWYQLKNTNYQGAFMVDENGNYFEMGL